MVPTGEGAGNQNKQPAKEQDCAEHMPIGGVEVTVGKKERSGRAGRHSVRHPRKHLMSYRHPHTTMMMVVVAPWFGVLASLY